MDTGSDAAGIRRPRGSTAQVGSSCMGRMLSPLRFLVSVHVSSSQINQPRQHSIVLLIPSTIFRVQLSSYKHLSTKFHCLYNNLRTTPTHTKRVQTACYRRNEGFELRIWRDLGSVARWLKSLFGLHIYLNIVFITIFKLIYCDLM